MSDNLYSSNDDDIFEDYVETTIVSEDISDISSDSQSTIDQVFSDIDSPFRNILQKSYLKVNFGDAFYNAAYEWVAQGYRESNSVAILNTLAEITNGKFLYDHRLLCSTEILNRKKTILKFLTSLLEDDSIETIVKGVKQDGSKDTFHFSETYFNMFFRSFYNIQLHSFYCEVAVYKTLCEMLNIEVDESLIDPFNSESLEVLTASDHVNNLYIKYFNHEEMTQKVEKYFDEVLKKKA